LALRAIATSTIVSWPAVRAGLFFDFKAISVRADFLFDFRVIYIFTDGRGPPQAPIFFDFRTIFASMFAARLQARLNTWLSSKLACRLRWKPT